MTLLDRWATIGQATLRSATAVNAQFTDQGRTSTYALLGSLYANEMPSLREGINLQPIYNPTRRVVDWYAGRTYADVWTDDGLPLPDGTPSTVPFAEDTEEAVRLASMQALSWSNWNRSRYVYVRHGGTFGDVFLKPTLDIEAGKVYVKVFEPKYVTDLEFNARGDVIAYMLEFPVEDANGPLVNTRYTYGERWTKETVTTYRDGAPKGYDGNPAEQLNPFGFVPGVWVNHRHIGGIHGAPAVDGVIPKIQELNRLVDSAHTFIRKLNRQPVWVASSGNWGTEVKVISSPTGDQEGVGTFKGPADMQVGRLLEDIGLAPGLEYIRNLMGEIEKDLPETTVDEQLRSMQQVTGPGAARIMGDVAYKLYEVEGNYDVGLIDACQMMISMGAFAVRSGLWGRQLTEAQRLFGAFDLTSFDRGQLSITFMQRLLVQETAMERIQEAAMREALKTPQAMIEAGYSVDQVYGEGAVRPTTGILAERGAQTQTAGSLFGNLLNTGAV